MGERSSGSSATDIFFGVFKLRGPGSSRPLYLLPLSEVKLSASSTARKHARRWAGVGGVVVSSSPPSLSLFSVANSHSVWARSSPSPQERMRLTYAQLGATYAGACLRKAVWGIWVAEGGRKNVGCVFGGRLAV
jgi:hypothetical protein